MVRKHSSSISVNTTSSRCASTLLSLSFAALASANPLSLSYALQLTPQHQLEIHDPGSPIQWYSSAVAVRPLPAAGEFARWRVIGKEGSTSSGVVIGQCYVATNVHVLFHPGDLLSFGRELERTALVLTQGGHLFNARTIFSNREFWIDTDKATAVMKEKHERLFARSSEDIALLRLEPSVIKGADGSYRRLNIGDVLPPKRIASEAPHPNTTLSAFGIVSRPHAQDSQPFGSLPLNFVVDTTCKAATMQFSGRTVFRGTCHVIGGMSGGGIISRSENLLYGLIHSGDILHNGAVPKDQQLRGDLVSMPLNGYVPLWVHRPIIEAIIEKHPCTRP